MGNVWVLSFLKGVILPLNQVLTGILCFVSCKDTKVLARRKGKNIIQGEIPHSSAGWRIHSE